MADRITIDEQIAEVRRELALRKNVYPKWVASGRMKPAEADRSLERMQAVHDTLTGLKPAVVGVDLGRNGPTFYPPQPQDTKDG